MYLFSIAILKYIARVYLKISKYFKVGLMKTKRASTRYVNALFLKPILNLYQFHLYRSAMPVEQQIWRGSFSDYTKFF
jgi:hypothetical protein